MAMLLIRDHTLKSAALEDGSVKTQGPVGLQRGGAGGRHKGRPRFLANG